MSRSILIVDDNRLAREVLRRRLQGKGFDVRESESGEEAVDLVRRKRFDLVLLDLVMPGLDGLQTLQRIRAALQPTDLPVLMLSAQDESSDIVEALSAGANDYISKASDFAVILARIQTQIAIRRLTERIQELAVKDPLTGLFNRRGFFELADKETGRVQRYGGSLNAILADLDRFKKVNDTHGHRFGDVVLEKCAQACLGELRSTDLIGRWGGEEFAILLPEIDAEGALLTAERLRSVVAGLVIEAPSGTIPVTLSAGVAEFDDSCSGLADLMNRADAALYLAKREGRNRVCAYREG